MKKIILSLLLCFMALSATAADVPSFKKALKKYHRHGAQFNFSTFHDNITWDVIYKSAEFREAAAYKYAKDYRLSDSELQAKLVDEEQAALKGPEFIVLVFTYSKAWNNFDAPDSVWKLRLEAEGKQFDPVSIVAFKPTPLETSLYPFFDPWTKAYSVLFPTEAYAVLNEQFSLSAFGAKGKSTLRWKIKK